MSRTSSAVVTLTWKDRALAPLSIRPSWVSRSRASRTGIVLTSRASAICSWVICSPADSSPVQIMSRMISVTWSLTDSTRPRPGRRRADANLCDTGSD